MTNDERQHISVSRNIDKKKKKTTTNCWLTLAHVGGYLDERQLKRLAGRDAFTHVHLIDQSAAKKVTHIDRSKQDNRTNLRSQ